MKKLYWVLFISLFVKLILALIIPITYDESYYWIWSQNMRWSYYDHPPFISWLLYFGDILYKTFDVVGLIRWPGILLSQFGVLLWCNFIANELPENRKLLLALLLSFNPLTGLGCIIQTPDLPLLFFWTTSLIAFANLINSQKLINYIFLGISLGLGFSSKYHIVIFFVCGVLYLFYSKQWNKISFLGVFVSLVFFFVGAFPVFYWNFSNDFQSFKFQLNHGLGSRSYDVQWTTDYIIGQIFAISPFVIWSVFKNNFKKIPPIFSFFAITPFLFFLLTSFKAHVEANWPSVGIPMFLTIALWGTFSKKNVYAHLAVWFIIPIAMVIGAYGKFDPNEIHRLQFCYLEKLDLVKKYKPLYTNRYQMASFLSLYTKESIFKLRGFSRFDFYDTLDGSIPPDEFYFVMDIWDQIPENILKEFEFKEIEKDKEIIVFSVQRKK